MGANRAPIELIEMYLYVLLHIGHPKLDQNK